MIQLSLPIIIPVRYIRTTRPARRRIDSGRLESINTGSLDRPGFRPEPETTDVHGRSVHTLENPREVSDLVRHAPQQTAAVRWVR
ncbi:hypothetical protein D8S78_10935 [Natrialba swarupiae]|nr:hypothetical protein [Natrialba swarupiae]